MIKMRHMKHKMVCVQQSNKKYFQFQERKKNKISEPVF